MADFSETFFFHDFMSMQSMFTKYIKTWQGLHSAVYGAPIGLIYVFITLFRVALSFHLFLILLHYLHSSQLTVLLLKIHIENSIFYVLYCSTTIQYFTGLPSHFFVLHIATIKWIKNTLLQWGQVLTLISCLFILDACWALKKGCQFESCSSWKNQRSCITNLPSLCAQSCGVAEVMVPWQPCVGVDKRTTDWQTFFYYQPLWCLYFKLLFKIN